MMMSVGVDDDDVDVDDDGVVDADVVVFAAADGPREHREAVCVLRGEALLLPRHGNSGRGGAVRPHRAETVL